MGKKRMKCLADTRTGQDTRDNRMQTAFKRGFPLRNYKLMIPKESRTSREKLVIKAHLENVCVVSSDMLFCPFCLPNVHQLYITVCTQAIFSAP